MKAASFDYRAPGSIEEAVSLLADLGEDAKAIAGGQSLVPMLALRLAVFDRLVDLRRVEALRGMERRDGGLWIGTSTTQAAIQRSAEVARSVPLLARATPLIGHFQIRNRGTIGGSIAHADAAAEYPAVALALEAWLEAVSPRGPRSIPADRFFHGLWSTELAADELLTGVTFPAWGGRSGFAIEEVARRGGDFAVAGAAVAVRLDAGERVSRCGIGLFGLGPAPLRARAAEAALNGSAAGALTAEDAAEIGNTAMAGLESVPSDLHASADYRRRAGAVLVARALQRAVQEARSA